ncbi:tail fiber assembly protein [Salmonella enterica subsp. enterica]|nr:tail fiber assembly protein [Salmonella enterica]EDP9049235.1 tail fiber assembly protein [Salmonella enterica subsp. enterica serovar Abony]HBJ6378724.1 tail fiber assembly protein [Salmonella enterica subsp. enterica serovar Eastbourne]EEE9875832.1 hypothetical protein [Salmonella enterica]EEJ0783902.1 tail fiber assembly protein [Salmonella enterica]
MCIYTARITLSTIGKDKQLNAWKKYRVLVNRVDTSKPEWSEESSV